MSATTYAERKALFEKFMAENPNVYGELVARTRRAKERSRVPIGMRCIWEAARYDWSVNIRHDQDAPRLNDWLAPFFSRLIMEREPDLAGYFETRGEAPDRVEPPAPPPPLEPEPYREPAQDELFGGGGVA
jgi:hypothetical protein